MEEQKRENFRIAYLGTQTPVLKIGSHSILIRDISATGIRLELDQKQALPAIDRKISGQVNFPDGVTVNIKGKVLRTEEKNRVVIILLDTEIPGNIIMDQHRSWISTQKASS